MRRSARILSIGAAVGLGVSLAACSESGGSSGSSTSAATTGDIKIGAVLDITGAGASLGVPERQTLEMLTDQVNSSGGVSGRQIKLLIEDNQSTEDAAAKATNKLLSTEKVDVLIGASRTGPSLAMRPIAEQAQKPMISLAANQSIINGAKWVFKTAQNDRVVVEKIVDDMAAKGIKNIAIARDASGFGEGIPEMFTEVGKPAGITVVKVEKFAPDATDFTAQMVSIRDSHPDAVVIWGIPPAASLAQVAYKRLNVGAPVYQSHGIGNQVFLDTAGEAADGLLAPLGRMVVADQLKADDPQKPVVTKFIADYKAKYNQNPSTFAGHAYDAFWIAVNAFKKVGTDPNKLRDALEQVTDWPGVSGVFTMTASDHSGLTKDDMIMVTVANKQWKVAGNG
jgi:branched-chain amino acid transport system substrate-binding protein